MRRKLCLITLVVLLAVTWAGWWWHAERRLAAIDERHRDAGLPTTIRAYNDVHETGPSTPNGFVGTLESAEAAHDWYAAPTPRMSNDEFYPWEMASLDPQWRLLMRESLAANAAFFQAAATVNNLPIDPPIPLRENMNWRLSGARNIANGLTDEALYRHVQGDTATAFARLETVERLADHLRGGPNTIAFLVCSGIDALNTATLQQIAPTLRPDAQGLDRQVLRALIGRLLDNSGNLDRFLRSQHGDLLWSRHNVDQLASSVWVIRPKVKLDFARYADQIAPLRAPMEAGDFQTASGLFSHLVPKYEFLNGPADHSPAKAAGRELFFDASIMDQTVSVYFRERFDAEIAAISLAVAMYVEDHGVYPAELDALVPAYLPHVPGDVFSPDQAPLCYVMLRWPDGAPRPVIVSVGENGVADISANLRPDTVPTRDVWPLDPVPATPLYGGHMHTDPITDFTTNEIDDAYRDLSAPALYGPLPDAWRTAYEQELRARRSYRQEPRSDPNLVGPEQFTDDTDFGYRYDFDFGGF
ncbi:MAG: hypothetical protein AAF656_05425 [Planctomycetota bacterium]